MEVVCVPFSLFLAYLPLGVVSGKSETGVQEKLVNNLQRLNGKSILDAPIHQQIYHNFVNKQ